MPIQGRQIAEACGIPTAHLLKILQQLVRARVLSSERGPAGGFSLRKPPAQITLLEIIEAIEGRIDGELAGARDIPGMKKAKKGMEAACASVANHARKTLETATIKQLMG